MGRTHSCGPRDSRTLSIVRIGHVSMCRESGTDALRGGAAFRFLLLFFLLFPPIFLFFFLFYSPRWRSILRGSLGRANLRFPNDKAPDTRRTRPLVPELSHRDGAISFGFSRRRSRPRRTAPPLARKPRRRASRDDRVSESPFLGSARDSRKLFRPTGSILRLSQMLCILGGTRSEWCARRNARRSPWIFTSSWARTRRSGRRPTFPFLGWSRPVSRRGRSIELERTRAVSVVFSTTLFIVTSNRKTKETRV